MTQTTPNNQLEATLWATADKLRGHLDAADYKHVVLGLIFLKYISDAFQERYAQIKSEPYADPEDRDEYAGANIFWVPINARWPALQAKAKDPTIGLYLDQAMIAIEKDNPTLKGVLPQNYGREDLDKRRLGELIDLIGSIGLGDKASRSQDILGRVYEYFLGQFASAEGKKGGQFYTPQSIVQLLVEILQRYQSRAITSTQIIAELIELAHQMRSANQRGQQLGLTPEELAFYDALAENHSAVEVLGDKHLAFIAHELLKAVRHNATIDWTIKDSVRAKMRTIIKRILRQYGYPPDLEAKATATVIQQAELLATHWSL